MYVDKQAMHNYLSIDSEIDSYIINRLLKINIFVFSKDDYFNFLILICISFITVKILIYISLNKFFER